jgi:hypothetical protein
MGPHEDRFAPEDEATEGLCVKTSHADDDGRCMDEGYTRKVTHGRPSERCADEEPMDAEDQCRIGR